MTSDNLYLAHHGIKGQRWGVRRFQNPDGSLTEKGKLRYKVTDDGSLQKLTRRERKEARRQHVEAVRKKDMDDYVSGKEMRPMAKMYAHLQIENKKSDNRRDFIKSDEGRKLYDEWESAVRQYEELNRLSSKAQASNHEISSEYLKVTADQLKDSRIITAARKVAVAEGHYTASKLLDEYGESGMERFMSDTAFRTTRREGENVVDWYVRENTEYWERRV